MKSAEEEVITVKLNLRSPRKPRFRRVYAASWYSLYHREYDKQLTLAPEFNPDVPKGYPALVRYEGHLYRYRGWTNIPVLYAIKRIS